MDVLSELCTDLSATFPEGTLELVNGVFNTADQFVRNGELTVTELRSHLSGTQYHQFCEWLTSHHHYGSSDANHDGVIDRVELTEAAAEYLRQSEEDGQYSDDQLSPQASEALDVDSLAESIDPQELLRIGLAVAHRERAARKDMAAKERGFRQASKIRRQQCVALEQKLREVSDAANEVREERDTLRDCAPA